MSYQPPPDPNQPPYNQNQQGQPPYYTQQPYNQTSPYGYPGALPSANGNLILGLGIASFFCFGIILGPIAWIMGNSSLRAIDSGMANPMERGNVSAGRVCGIVATILHGIGLAFYGLFVVAALVSAGSHTTGP